MSPLLLLLLVALVSCHHFDEECPHPEVMEDLDVEKMDGLWYEVANLPTPQLPEKKCTKMTQVHKGNGRIDVNKQAVDENTNEQLEYNFSVDYKGPQEDGKMVYNFPGIPHLLTIYVIDTDYDNYISYYRCERVDSQLEKWVHIFSREPTLSKDILDRLVKQLKDAGVDVDSLQDISQSDCP